MGQMGSAPFASTRRRRRDGGAFSPLALYANGEAGGWYDPSDLTPEKVSWRRNLLTYSEQFDNSAWTKSNASILSNLLRWSQDFTNASVWSSFQVTVASNAATAPDGSATATRLTDDTNSLSHLVFASAFSVTAGVQYTLSAFAAPGTRSHFNLRVNDNTTNANAASVLVNVSNGTITGAATAYGTFTNASAVVTSAANGFYRVALTFTPSVSSVNLKLEMSDGSARTADGQAYYTGTGSGTLLVWGAQLVPGTTAQTYTPTTSAAAPIPFTAPDGSATADKLVENTANNAHYMAQSYTTIASAYTVSVHLKAEGRSWAAVELQGIGFAYVNLSTGVIGGNSGLTASNVTAVGNGWYRLVMTLTASAGARAINVYTASADNTASYAGDGTSGILVWGAQLELAPTASSYQRITDFTSDFLAAFPQHALYQDSAGTTPVTALGQPVGLVLDKSKGGLANLGPELVTNGDFSSGTTGWTAGGTTTLQVTNGVMRATGTTDGAYFGQQINVVSGRTYRLSATFGNDGTSKAGQINLGTALGTANRGSVTSFGFGLRQVVYTATATETLWIWFYPGFFGSSNYLLVDDVTVREVPGAHAIQATSASRPTCDARVNLLEYSEQFDNAYWTKDNVFITANAAVAPDGTTTADLMYPPSTGSLRWVRRFTTVTGTASYRMRIAVKTSGLTWAYVLDVSGTGGAAWINTQTGALGTVAAGYTATSRSLGNGWYELVVTSPSVAGPSMYLPYIGVSSSDNSLNVTANGTDGVLIWGADLRLASDASLPYQRVVTASDYADVQAPRYLTFDGIDDSLYTAASVDFATWTSGTRRNLLTYPSAFDNAYWARTATTVSANNAVAPDGTQTADTLVETTAASTHSVYVNAGTYTGAYTQSVYVKPAGRTWVFLEPNGGSATRTFYNLSGAGSLGTVGTNVTASIAAVGNGWYRITATFTYAAAAAFISISLTTGDGVASYTGDGTSGVHLWGAQLELGTTATAFQDVGTDKMTVVTGVRKLSDAALGMLMEFGPNANSTNGTWYVTAPNQAATANYVVQLRGDSAVTAFTATPYAAPITNVITTLLDIGGATGADEVQVRANGATAAGSITTAGPAGAGTFSSQVLNISRRNNASLPFNGRLYQLIVRGAQTDTATVQQTERFVAGKTGLVI